MLTSVRPFSRCLTSSEHAIVLWGEGGGCSDGTLYEERLTYLGGDILKCLLQVKVAARGRFLFII